MTTATEQANLDISADVYAAFGRGDIATVVDANHEDSLFVSNAPAESPLRGEWKGRDGVAGYFGLLNETLDITRFDVQRMFASGDQVIVTIDAAYTVRATDAPFDGGIVNIITMEDGKATRFEIYTSESSEIWKG